MNAFGFFFRRLAQQVGFRRERQRWGAVNRETQILSEAEDLLGRLAWRDVKDIEELSGEYWQILDIHEQQEKLREETREADARCEDLKSQFNERKWAHEDSVEEMKQRKAQATERALELMREIEQIRQWKEETKRKFVNLKTKVKVMQRHEGESGDISDDLQRTESQMDRLKDEFAKDLAEIQRKTDEVEACEREVEDLEEKIQHGKKHFKESNAGLQTEVGRLSKKVAELSARIGALENTKSEYFARVGHYLSNNLQSRDPLIRDVLRKHRPLVSRIAYFRRSIAFNQQLARRARR